MRLLIRETSIVRKWSRGLRAKSWSAIGSIRSRLLRIRERIVGLIREWGMAEAAVEIAVRLLGLIGAILEATACIVGLKRCLLREGIVRIRDGVVRLRLCLLLLVRE